MGNQLAGAGPQMASGGSDGPSPTMTGTTGNAPQASPDNGNMLAGSPPQGQSPQQPPSKEQLLNAFHKTSIVNEELKGILGKPELSVRDVIDVVGNIVSQEVMSAFDATNYLKDLPPDGDSAKLRQWVAGHYTKSAQTLQTVAEMLHAEGQAGRDQAQMAAQQASPMPMTNAFQSAPMMGGMNGQ